MVASVHLVTPLRPLTGTAKKSFFCFVFVVVAVDDIVVTFSHIAGSDAFSHKYGHRCGTEGGYVRPDRLPEVPVSVVLVVHFLSFA